MPPENEIEFIPDITELSEPSEPEPFELAPAAPPPPDPNLVAAQEQAAADGHEVIECPCCKNSRWNFTIIDGLCDSCRMAEQPPGIVAMLGWPEVRDRRDRMISGLDWTQLPDVNPATSEEYAVVRQSLRDITEYPTPLEAWVQLDALESEVNK